MKKLITAAALTMLVCGGAYAADKAADKPMAASDKPAATAAGDKPMTAQQMKMKTCNADAADKKGEDRQKFMKTCLSAKPAKAESKMAMCNKKTAGMKADERAKAQSECMKG